MYLLRMAACRPKGAMRMSLLRVPLVRCPVAQPGHRSHTQLAGRHIWLAQGSRRQSECGNRMECTPVKLNHRLQKRFSGGTREGQSKMAEVLQQAIWACVLTLKGESVEYFSQGSNVVVEPPQETHIDVR